MIPTRKQVLEKLEDYLKRRITKEEVYKWASLIVQSSEYDKLSEKDKLLSDAIQVLWELHHENEELDPSKSEIQHYIDSLKK